MITITAPPEGILNASNLYNDVYGFRKPLAWADLEFQAKLAWLPTVVPGFKIISWYAPVNVSPGVPNLTTSTMVRVGFGESEEGYDFDTLLLSDFPELVAYSLRKTAGIPSPFVPYPGFDAVFNVNEDSPVGEKWMGNPWKVDRLYEDRGGERFPVGAEFDTPKAKYRKIKVSLGPGAGPFGIGGKSKDAWELIYSRE